MRLAAFALAALCLLAGVLGGIARLGLPIVMPRAAIDHGTLMISGFLGTVISLERAIALKRPYAFVAPLAAGIGALAILGGLRGAGMALSLAAPLVLAVATGELARRQPQRHMAVLFAAALAWVVAAALHLAGASRDAVAAWGFVFLVLTIAGERLEMTRLMRPRRGAWPLFLGACGVLVVGAALLAADAPGAAIVFGAGLAALAAWLAMFDIAWRTIRTEGLARFAATALLAGYFWLAAAGLAWAAAPENGTLRDAALHALGMGFVFSMIFAHAPIIVPVVAGLRVRFHPFLYVPLALLHASVALRVAGDLGDVALRRWSGVANAAAIVLFALAMAALSRRAPGSQGGPAEPVKVQR